MMISGNHDSAARINIFRSVLSRQHIHMIGLPPQRPEEREISAVPQIVEFKKRPGRLNLPGFYDL